MSPIHSKQQEDTHLCCGVKTYNLVLDPKKTSDIPGREAPLVRASCTPKGYGGGSLLRAQTGGNRSMFCVTSMSLYALSPFLSLKSRKPGEV